MIERRLGQIHAADALVGVLVVQMREANRPRMDVALLVVPRSRDEHVPVRVRRVRLHDAGGCGRVRALTSPPSTAWFVPAVPIALESRNRDIAPTMSWSRTGRSSSA